MGWLKMRMEGRRRAAVGRSGPGTRKPPKVKQIRPHSPVPRCINLELTNYCNLSCPMCARTSAMTRPLKHMDVEAFKRITDQAVEMGIPKLRLHQFGEPLLHPRFFELARYATIEKGIKCTLSTNVTALNAENARRLLDETAISGITLAVDADSAETYRIVRAGPGSDFDRVIRNAQRFLEMHRERGSTRKVTLLIVDMPIKGREVEAFKHRWQAFESPNVKINIKRCTDFADRVDRTGLGWEDGKPEDPARSGAARRKPCSRLWRDMTIQSDGTVVACSFDVNGDLPTGDACVSSLEEIWNGEQAMELRRRHWARDFSRIAVCDGCGFTHKDAKAADDRQ